MKVLIVAYLFPPCAAVGLYRTLKFCKSLPPLGWQPVVLTVSNGKHAKYDERLLKLVSDEVPVYRAPAIEWFNVGEDTKTAGRPKRRTLLSRIYGRLCMVWNLFAIPDNNVSWVPFAIIKGYRVVKREGIRHVYVTGKPFSSFLIGVMLKKLCGTRLVIDYRDPWTQNINYERR